MKRQTLKSLQVALDSATYGETEMGRKYYATRDERDAALKEVKEVREQFADIKRRLLEAETETARLRGYLARVHEDDIVRDGLVEIEDAQGKRLVPKRPPPMNAGAVEHYEQFNSSVGYGSNKKQTHWTNY